MAKNLKVHFSSAHDHWSTPKDVYAALDKEFNFTYDPCPLNSKENNIGKRWGGSALLILLIVTLKHGLESVIFNGN